MITRATILGLGWAAIAVFIWSGSLVMMRFGVTTNLNAYDLTMLRFGVAALILTPVVVRRGIGTNRLGPLGVLAMIITFGAPYVLLIALSMTTAPASAAGSINPGVMAIFVVLIGHFICGDKVGPVRLLGLSTLLVGIGWFTWAGGVWAAGHFILIGTGLMWAIYTLIVRHAAIPALNAAALIAVGSAILYLPIYAAILPKQIFTAPLLDILVQAGFQGVLVSVVTIYAFNRSAELLGPVAGATIPALIPVVTLGLGVFTLGETAKQAEILAAILVTIGLTMILVGHHLWHWLSNHLPHTAAKKPHP